jgi:predicted RNA-binding protein
VLLILFFSESISDVIPNPTNNPVIGFINKEKFRNSVEDVVDRFQNPHKYLNEKNTEIQQEILLSNENEINVSSKKYSRIRNSLSY